ncbi:MAG: acyl-CoA dehydrogenase [Gammaproteobacteria bacterium]|nr:acyl-CoA dehydrogenase [Gammaproteobacteria bacterium]
MSAYTPPLDDVVFLLEEVIDTARLMALPRYAHVDAALVRAVLGEGARFAADVLGPLNSAADRQGARLVDGNVELSPGFTHAWRLFAEGGWPGLDLPQEAGGQGLPLTVQAAFAEMVQGACLAFGMLQLNGRAAAHLLLEHGHGGLREHAVPRLVAGDWAATICISEPQAGSDVGRIRTRAEPRPDGSYTLSGTKIWISFADHDAAPQILQMVLARTPEAAPGTAGLSLFVVPKYLIEADGRPGARNHTRVARLEHKMGLHGSPTCVLDLDGAVGYRVGGEGAGLKCMFTMMNLMRLEVGIQGVAVAGAATAKALRYARERPQGGPSAQAPIAIIEHADVRRMLCTMRARTEPLRALYLEAALALDLARYGATSEARIEAGLLAEWLLPVCKACASEAGFEVASLAMQVLGGQGYTHEGGVEQYVRDSRVQAIYEGANGIQALDLVTRKLGRDQGRRYAVFSARVRADLQRLGSDPGLGALPGRLHEALGLLESCTAVLQDRLQCARRDAEAGAAHYLQLVGLVACGWTWLRMAAAATADSPLARGKRATARFFADYLLPEAAALERKALAGAGTIDALDGETLATYG